MLLVAGHQIGTHTWNHVRLKLVWPGYVICPRKSGKSARPVTIRWDLPGTTPGCSGSPTTPQARLPWPTWPARSLPVGACRRRAR